jgi:hypothetical protein
MHKWLGMTLFRSEGTCIVRIEDLKLMFAMIKRRKVSPVQFMIVHWSGIFKQKGEIEYSSLVARIANKLGLMENSLVEYIPWGQPHITIDYFRQGQMVLGKNIGIIMIYHGRTFEILLPNLGLGLYATNSLIMLPSSVAVGRMLLQE